jgi:hypothetical protein
MQIAREHAGVHGKVRLGEQQQTQKTSYKNTITSKIYRSTSEIQRDIVARSILGKAG